MPTRNPLKKRPSPKTQHVIEIVDEAMHAWIHNQKAPYRVTTNEGEEITLTPQEYVKIQTIIRQCLINMNLTVDHHLRREDNEDA